MSKNALLYFVLWLLIQLLVRINCQMTFRPKRRHDHTATFIDNKLYILGGSGYGGDNEFFYLDVSNPFNTQKLGWKDLSSKNIVPPHYGAAAVKGGVNNDTLFLYGVPIALIYTFDPKDESWNIPAISGYDFRKQFLTGTIDYNGIMYLFGQTSPGGLDDNLIMLILNTNTLSLGKGSLVNAPPGRSDYVATLLPNQHIIYLGSFHNNEELALSKVYIYDTINDKWRSKSTSGNTPSNRNYFSAILGLDGQRIIIFGGRGTTDLASTDTLYVLDLVTLEWHIPKISGSIPNSRLWHKANVFKNFMTISFGCCYDQSIESDILLLDISNNKEYMWTTSSA